MKIYGCLSWFDENPRWLAATVASMSNLCDHVVAVDGAFFHYPTGRPHSGGEQAATIEAVCAANGLGCTIHVPQTVWMGNEVEKRNAYLKIVQALATPYEDWFLVLDGDEEISSVSGLTHLDLEQTELDVATIGFWTTDELRSWFGPTRRLYRVLEDMEYVGTHFTIRSGSIYLDGRGPDYGEPVVDALDLTAQIKVEHKHHLRVGPRSEKADVFGKLRVSENLEPW